MAFDGSHVNFNYSIALATVTVILSVVWFRKSNKSRSPPIVCPPDLSSVKQPLRVVITGGTRGFGLALAAEFIKAGDHVSICGTSQESIDKALSLLQPLKSPSTILFAMKCDVSDASQVSAFALESSARLRGIDIWINNAGIDGGRRVPLLQNSSEMIEKVIATNLTGSLFGCLEAMKMMLINNPCPGGHIFNVDGSGSRGNPTPLLIAYGTSKRAIPLIASTLSAEADKNEHEKFKRIGIHTLSPGMVISDLLLRSATNMHAKKAFNLLAEYPETAAAALVPRIRSVHGTNQYIKYLTPVTAATRFATFWRYKNKFFDEETGQWIAAPSSKYPFSSATLSRFTE